MQQVRRPIQEIGFVIVGDCDRGGHPLAFRDFCAARVLADGTWDSAFATDEFFSANTTYVHDNKVRPEW